MTAAHPLHHSSRELGQPADHDLVIGTYRDGSAAVLPASVRNLLVRGRRAADASALAETLVDQWCEHGGHVLVVDLDGRHSNLMARPDVIVVEGAHPSGQALSTLFRRVRVVVLDLSNDDVPTARAQLGHLPAAVGWARRSSRMPLSVVIDSAHELLGEQGALLDAVEAADRGYVLVTHRPDELQWSRIPSIDAVLTARPPGPGDRWLEPLLACHDGPPMPFDPARPLGAVLRLPPEDRSAARTVRRKDGAAGMSPS